MRPLPRNVAAAEDHEPVVEVVEVRRHKTRSDERDKNVVAARSVLRGHHPHHGGKDAVVDEERKHRRNAELEKRPVDSYRIEDRVEMARRVLVEVDSLDWYLQGPRGMSLRVGEHRHLVLVAVAWELRDARHKRRGDSAEPRLRVADHEPRHQKEKPARPPVAEAASQGNLARKRPDAENQSVAVGLEAIRQLRDVLWCMLPVGVCGDDIGRVTYVREARLQRGAFAAVLLVHENRVNEGHGPFEHVLARCRAVVDEDDMPKTLPQPRKERQQLLVRIVGRDENRSSVVYNVEPHFPSLMAFSRAMRRM